jgi:hypothetical protein
MTLQQILVNVSCALALTACTVQAQTTQISTEYLMTLYAPLEAPQQIDDTLFIYTIPPGREGWVKGPKINGRIIPPGGDWVRVMPAGNARIDVRQTVKTDDGALIYISSNGIVSYTKESWDRLMKGVVITGNDHYFILAPTMQTSAEKYAWLNHVQCIGKVVEVKLGENAFLKYDVYIVR